MLGSKEEELAGKRHDCSDHVVIIRIRRCGWKCTFLDRNHSLPQDLTDSLLSS